MSEGETENKENSNGPTTTATVTATVKEEWTTWEELLLTCAVKRHGVKDWDSVAMELQTRCFPATITTTTTATTNGTTLGLTPQICRDKFRDLQRRFTTTTTKTNSEDVTAARDDGGDDLTVPWLEELRKLRVAELKQEVHRYDLSIQSLQMKVKRLEDERERSLKENDQNDDVKTDLEKDKTTANSVKHEEDEERSENNKKDGDEEPPNDIAGKSISGEDENRSFNESNSTDNRLTGSKLEPDPVETKPETIDHVKPAPVGGEDSCNDSSDRRRASQEGKVDSTELRDSIDDSKEGTATKESSDVQSSASLTRKKRRKRGGEESGEGNNNGGGGKEGGGDGGVDATTTTTTTTAVIRRENIVVKSEPLIRFLEIIRSHKHGPMFEHRLDIQKGDKYKSMVRQHMDLQTVQARIDERMYFSCSNKFYLDLLLIFNNAIVFFPKSSHESRAAHELRDLVMKEIKKKRARSPDPQPEPILVKLHQPKPDPDRPDSLLAKHKSAAPLVVCRKRSSITAKASSSSVNKVEKLSDNKSILNSKPVINKSSSSTQNEDDSSIKLKLKEKPVTGVRSMRRSGKGRTVSAAPSATTSTQNTSSSSQQQQPPPPSQSGSAQKGDDPKTDKKKVELNNAAAKKRGAADFLKRMKKNSPGKGSSSAEALIASTDDSKGGKGDHQKKKVEERKDAGPLRRSGNGNGKQAKEDNSPSKRSVGRPPKKGKDAAAAGKRGREGGGGGEGEGSSKRPNKRSRR